MERFDSSYLIFFYALYSDRAWRNRMPDHRAVVCLKWRIRVLPTRRRRRCGRFIRLPISLSVVCPLLAVCLSFDCRLIVLSPPSAYRVFSRARPAADFAAVYFRIFRFCFIYNLPDFLLAGSQATPRNRTAVVWEKLSKIFCPRIFCSRCYKKNC